MRLGAQYLEWFCLGPLQLLGNQRVELTDNTGSDELFAGFSVERIPLV